MPACSEVEQFDDAARYPGGRGGSLGWTALICNEAGLIIRHLGDGLDANSRSSRTKQSLKSFVSAASQQKVADFLRTIRDRMTAFGWQIEVGADRRLFLFHGCVTAAGILVLATPAVSGPEGVAALSAPQDKVQHSRENGVTQPAAAVQSIEVVGEARETVRQTTRSRVAEPLPLTHHDLKNVIISIVSAAEFLIDYTAENLSREQRELVLRIRTSAGILLTFSDQLFSGGRMEPHSEME